ncbi:hybrid signal transduction histidine kinase M [Tanacetum coccineum]
MTRSEVPIPTTLLSDKLSLVTHHHLLTRVPFIRGIPTDASTTSTTIPYTLDELKVDKIILSWIFTTISDPLQKRLVVARPKSAKEAWDMLTDMVKDNKRTRASTLKTELRSIKLGALSMEAYFQKIESLVTTLTSLDCVVNEEDIVHYAIAGLPEKYIKFVVICTIKLLSPILKRCGLCWLRRRCV